MFCSNQLLRYNSDTQYNTITGGLLSIAVIVVIVIGFASMIADTLNRTSITSSITTTKNSDPPLSVLTTGQESRFMFAVAIQSYDQAYFADLSSTTQFFDVKMFLYKYVDGWSTLHPVELQPCTKQHWSMLPDFVDRFNTYNVSSWLCLPLNHEFTLQGAFTSPLNDAISIEVHACRNKSAGVTCAPQAEIDQLFEDYGNFYFTFNYVNPVINPNSVKFIDYYLEGDSYGIFSDKIGSQTWVSFSDYSITTDNSIWPYSDYLYQKGCIVQSKASNHPYSIAGDIIYASVYLAKSGNSLAINRQVQKISAVFSYIGGLVGAVTALLFLVKSYTDSSLEITIGLNLFDHKDNPDDAGSEVSSFGLLSYFYLLFYRISKSFNWSKKWQLSKKLDSYQQQAVKQLDVQILLRRLIKLETCMARLLTPQQIEKIKEKGIITVETAYQMRLQLLKSYQKEQEAKKVGQTNHNNALKNDMFCLKMVDTIQNTETGMGLNRQKEVMRIEDIETDQTKDHAKPSQKKYRKKEQKLSLPFPVQQSFYLQSPLKKNEGTGNQYKNTAKPSQYGQQFL